MGVSEKRSLSFKRKGKSRLHRYGQKEKTRISEKWYHLRGLTRHGNRKKGRSAGEEEQRSRTQRCRTLQRDGGMLLPPPSSNTKPKTHSDARVSLLTSNSSRGESLVFVMLSLRQC